MLYATVAWTRMRLFIAQFFFFFCVELLTTILYSISAFLDVAREGGSGGGRLAYNAVCNPLSLTWCYWEKKRQRTKNILAIKFQRTFLAHMKLTNATLFQFSTIKKKTKPNVFCDVTDM
jgi:hypothetical protein